jgi:hypothetical protein
VHLGAVAEVEASPVHISSDHGAPPAYFDAETARPLDTLGTHPGLAMRRAFGAGLFAEQ